MANQKKFKVIVLQTIVCQYSNFSHHKDFQFQIIIFFPCIIQNKKFFINNSDKNTVNEAYNIMIWDASACIIKEAWIGFVATTWMGRSHSISSILSDEGIPSNCLCCGSINVSVDEEEPFCLTIVNSKCNLQWTDTRIIKLSIH